MKYWLSQLEVWVDIFRYPWASREKMVRIVDKIGNYKFAEYMQYYLHDWGKRKLNKIYFDKDVFKIPRQIVVPIRQQFLDATSPCTFAMILRPRLCAWEFADEFHLKNDIVEELYLVWHTEWMWALSNHLAPGKLRHRIAATLTIGKITKKKAGEVDQDGNGSMADEEDEAIPSTSAKIMKK